VTTEPTPTPEDIKDKLRRIARRKAERRNKDRQDTEDRNHLFIVGRHELNMTTTELAQEAGVTTQTVRDVLNAAPRADPAKEAN
jgi:DNA-directed RNA polymerase specialized sigma subunit